MSPPLRFDPSLFPGDADQRRKRFLDEMQKLQWFQQVRVEDGITTPGSNDSHWILERMAFPKDLSGRSVLDVGAFDGAMSFECERRGADRVVAFDLIDNRPTLRLVHEYLRSKVEIVRGSIYTIDPKKLGVFDYVLFCGVLYHCRYPALAIDRLRTVTRATCFVETHISRLDVRYPATGLELPLTVFYENREWMLDQTNWTAPNCEQVMGWFRSAGFDIAPIDIKEDRGTFKADVRPGVPPYIVQAYNDEEYAGMDLLPTEP
jgi:tRNA (mo5U34)-methyltransferase